MFQIILYFVKVRLNELPAVFAYLSYIQTLSFLFEEVLLAWNILKAQKYVFSLCDLTFDIINH